MKTYTVLHSRETPNDLKSYLKAKNTKWLLKLYDQLREEEGNLRSKIPSDVAIRKVLVLIATILNQRSIQHWLAEQNTLNSTGNQLIVSRMFQERDGRQEWIQ